MMSFSEVERSEGEEKRISDRTGDRTGMIVGDPRQGLGRWIVPP